MTTNETTATEPMLELSEHAQLLAEIDFASAVAGELEGDYGCSNSVSQIKGVLAKCRAALEEAARLRADTIVKANRALLAAEGGANGDPGLQDAIEAWPVEAEG